jgi:hypothetical protein
VRSFTAFPLSPAIAASASALLVISTKAKPFDRPLYLSVTTLIEATSPKAAKSFLSSSSVVS